MKAFRVLFAAGLLATASTAQAHVVSFAGTLAPEAAGATGSGFVQVDYEEEIHRLTINTTFSGLSGNTSIAHIHCCVATPGTGNAGIAVTPNTLPGFPAGVKSGSYLRNLDLSADGVFTSGFLAANGGSKAASEVALINALTAGNLAYFNIHTSALPGGEIRAFLNPVPEPGTVALMLAGLGLLGLAARRQATSRL